MGKEDTTKPLLNTNGLIIDQISPQDSIQQQSPKLPFVNSLGPNSGNYTKVTSNAEDVGNNYEEEIVRYERDPNFVYQNSDEEDGFDDFEIPLDDDIEKDPVYKATSKSMFGRLSQLRRRNWFARNFRPVSNGGIRGSAFT